LTIRSQINAKNVVDNRTGKPISKTVARTLARLADLVA
jgi:hypothetical protein